MAASIYVVLDLRTGKYFTDRFFISKLTATDWLNETINYRKTLWNNYHDRIPMFPNEHEYHFDILEIPLPL